MHHDDELDEQTLAARAHYRPPIGIPVPATGENRRWAGTLASVLLHTLLVILLLTPLLASDAVRERVLGAGDSGPAGGGGGGNRGAGGRNAWLSVHEALHYIQVAPPPPPPPVTPPVVPPPVVAPPPVPPVPRPPAQVPPPVAEVSPPAAVNAAPAGPAPGGVGTGRDGSTGDGPGSGGGVGSGVGTGRGSGIGPGSGGDSTGGVFLPSPTETILPPFDAPSSVRGAEIVVTFDIDEQGRILSVSFPPTRDGGFNRKLRERLEKYRFRPGHTAAGQPVRATYQMSIFIS